MILQYEDKLPFGKYKGVTIVELIFRDSSYLLWFSRTIKQFKLPERLRSVLEAYDSEYDLWPTDDMLHSDWGDRDEE